MMPPQEIDISWQVLREIVQAWSGTSAELVEVRPLAGGQINTTLSLETRDGHKSVIKISPHRVNRDHEREAYQLNLLRELGLPTPKVYSWKMGSLDEPFSYILMEFVNGIDLAEAKNQCDVADFDLVQVELAELVLRMHAHTAEKYMRVMGPGGDQYESWPEFFRAVYDPIWKDIEKSPLLPVKARKQIGRVHDRLERLIVHSDCPRLVHWDIWATNILVNRNGDGSWHVVSILDPNCKYAHAEAEIAYMDLFHTITPAFLKAYQQNQRLDDEYHRVRKVVYQLYPLIDHVHLFGQEYVKPLLATVDKLGAVV
jgi:fructosamine-3-kinase